MLTKDPQIMGSALHFLSHHTNTPRGRPGGAYFVPERKERRPADLGLLDRGALTDREHRRLQLDRDVRVRESDVCERTRQGYAIKTLRVGSVSVGDKRHSSCHAGAGRARRQLPARDTRPDSLADAERRSQLTRTCTIA
eukprot:1456560-Rhodomonas_salina.1